MSGWQVLDLTGYDGAVKSARGGLVIDGRRVAVADIDVILMGPKVAAGPGLMHKAGRFGVSVVYCDWRFQPVAAVHPWSSNTRVGARHIAQATMSLPRKKNAWMRIVKAKIQSQQNTLSLVGRVDAAKRLSRLSAQVRSGDPENCEAQAAHVYWQALYGEKGFTRDPGAEDALNGAHNYGYTILRGVVLNAVVAAGLCPTLGVHHRGRSNVFALVDDLIEPFRCVVDRAVVSSDVIRETFPDPLARKAIVSAVYGDEVSRASEHGGSPAPRVRELVQAYAGYVEKASASLSVPVM